MFTVHIIIAPDEMFNIRFTSHLGMVFVDGSHVTVSNSSMQSILIYRVYISIYIYVIIASIGIR